MQAHILIALLLCIMHLAKGGIDEEVAAWMSSGEHQRSIALLESLDSSERTSSRLISLARAYSLSGMPNSLQSSERVLMEHIEAHGEEVVGYTSLGKLLIHLQRVEEAEAVLRKGEIKSKSANVDASFLTVLGKSIANNPSRRGDPNARAEALEYALRAEAAGSTDAMVNTNWACCSFFSISMCRRREERPSLAVGSLIHL